jgi:hypothetical protein
VIQECQFQYGGGRHCRRIPKRGEAYCRDHRRSVRALPPAHPRLARAFDSDAAVSRERYRPPLGGLGLDELLLDIAASLHSLEPLVRGSASSQEILRYQRACTAAGLAMDRVAGLPVTLRQALPRLPTDRLALLCRFLMFAAPASAKD